MNEPVAIVGIGCRFPGGIDGAASFWRAIAGGVDAVSEIPRDRIDTTRWFDPKPATPGRMSTRWGGFLDHLDELDAPFFRMSPREAERLDPGQRVLLEASWEAFEDAGIDPLGLEGSRTGVFIGQWLNDFEARLFARPEEVDFFMTLGSGRYASSGRISHVLGLRGPSLTLDTACSSSLVALHLACRSLRAGESELALAGGVNVILEPHISIAYSQSRMMASRGRCRFGDAGGDGYVRSEGAGVVLLKPLARARADGDLVHAVLRGSAVNNDGRTSVSLGTPSRVGHEEVLRAAYADAGITPARAGYLEAHGTGTSAGDPVELAALAAVVGPGRAAGSRCLVGSVKTNLGHTEGAAGIAGVIKVALALEHGTIPASLHHETPNPTVPWAELPLAVPTATTAWPRGAEPRVGGVSSLGIAGTNAHAVLEEAPRIDAPAVTPGRPLSLLPLSARSPEALRALAGRYAELLEAGDAPALHDVCFSAATRRAALEHRAAFVAADRAAMAAALRRHAAGEPAAAEGVAGDTPPKLVFVAPGQGAQWPGMARELLAREPAFRAALERCDAAARRVIDWSLVDELAAARPRLDEIDVIQPLLVALAIAYGELWRSLGVEPDAVVGHSMGEVAAAHLAGALDAEQAMRIVCRRSALMRRESGRGAMALVELSLDEARARVAGREARIGVAVENGPRSCVLSGDPAAIEEILGELSRDGIFCRPVKVDVAAHSPQMEPAAAELRRELDGLAGGAARVPLHSTVLARRVDGRELDADYFAKNLRQPVLFGATVAELVDAGHDVFVELGPHPVLLPSVQQTAQARGRAVTTIACARRDEPEQAALLAALGGLWAAGVKVDWRKLMPEGGRALRLPLYPWQRERFWVEQANPVAPDTEGRAARRRPDEESLGWLHRLEWRPADPPAARAESGGWLVVADGAAGREIAGALGADLTSLDRLAESRGAWRGVVAVAGDGPDAAFLPVAVLQAVAGWPSPPRLWFVTRGGQAVAAGARVNVDHAALWGAARVVAEEHPELWGGLCDLDAAGDPRLLAEQLAARDGEDQVALRGGKRFVLRLAPAAIRDGGSFAWRADASYLVTGGLGDIGLHVARAMVAQGARRLVLVARRPLPPRAAWATSTDARVAAVRALEAAGAAVHTAAVDVGDEAQLAGFLERHRAEGWPPIRGVVHVAGALDNHLAAAMPRAAFDALLRSKLRGAQLLDRLLPELDLFALFSSTGGFLAQPGQANYAAANAGLDALAQDRRARGLPALSVAWGVWAGTGLVKGAAGEQNVAEMARQGLGSFAPERATALWSWLLGSAAPDVAVVAADWAAYRRARAGREAPLARDLAAAGAEPELRARLEDAEPAERRRLVEGVVRDSVGRVLRVAAARLDPRRALGELGLNSLLAMELRNRLEAALGRSLSATLAWNYPTIAALVDHLAGGAAPAAERAPEAAPALADIAALSDDEALQALRRGTT